METYEAYIQGQLTYLKAFQTATGVVYVNIHTGNIERPNHVNPMRLAQRNMYRVLIDRCRLPKPLEPIIDIETDTHPTDIINS